MHEPRLVNPLLLEVVLGPSLEPDLAEGERDEQTQMPRHQPQPAMSITFNQNQTPS